MTEAEVLLVKRRRQYDVVKTLTAIAIGVVILLVLIVEVLILMETREGTERLLDCSTPEGECYEESQQRTAEAVTLIVQETQKIQDRGSAPSRYNVLLTEANSTNIALICEELALECISPPLQENGGEIE